jgi:predicted cation transporter
VRILLVSFFALATTLAVFPVVDEAYFRFLYNDATRLLPSLVSVGVGIIMYIWGWRLIIGTIGEAQPVRLAAFWYLVIGILAVLLVIGLLVQGYSIGTAPD